MKQPLKLTEVEIHSALWLRISEHLREKLNALRIENDGNRDEISTARLRGRIAQIKEFLALGETEPVNDAVTQKATD